LVEERWTGVKLGPDNPEAAAKTGFERVLALGALDEELPRLLMKEDKVYVELTGSEALPTPTSNGLMEWLKRSRAIPGRIPTADVRPIMASLRTVKDAGELALMKKAAEASMAAHLAVMKALKPGMNEREVAAILNYEAEKRGCERPSYAPIVGSGFNGTVLHYSEDDGPINAGDLVVIDAAGEYSMYADDITRTLPASGKFTPRQREIYDIVLGAQQAAIAAFQGIADVAVTSLPNAAGNHEVVAIIVGKGEIDLEALGRHCAAQLSPQFVPAHFAVTDRLPRNDMGKIDRPQLVERLRSSLAGQAGS